MQSSQFKSMSNDSIYHLLKDDILNLRLEPGQFISENGIAKKYNVSRTPVKAAFLRLSSEKFIEIVPQKGTFVTLLDLELAKEIIYMRSILEGAVIQSIIDNVPEEVISKLTDNLKKQEDVINSSNIELADFYKIDTEFHSILFEFAGKIKLWHIIQQQFQVYYTRFRMLDLVAARKLNRVYEEHLEILEAIKKCEKDKIENILTRHLNGNISRLSDKIFNELKHYFVT